MIIRKSLTLLAFAVTLLSTASLIAENAYSVEAGEVFATIDGGIVISRAEFEREVWAAARQTFYHGRPPAGEAMIEFRNDVAEKLIDRHLLLREARRRNLEPDYASVAARISTYENRYQDTERWQREGERMLAALTERFEEDSILEALQAQELKIATPDDDVLQDFYTENPSLFTEPAQNRVQLILLAVPASSTSAVWSAARDEARRIINRYETGTAFGELARMHSADSSAENDGDMGYLHAGMLSGNAETAIAGLEVGSVSEPVTVLEGIALFRLTERKSEQLRAFDEVRQRAADLWIRQQGEQRWNALLAGLRSDTDIHVDMEYLSSLTGSID